jgi:hypothetical protein
MPAHLKEDIDDDPLEKWQSHPKLAFLISTHINLDCFVEGNPGFVRENPTCEQYAALINKSEILNFLLHLSEPDEASTDPPESFESYFCPVSSGTKENLLTLAVHTRLPPLKPGLPQEPPPTDALVVILDYFSANKWRLGNVTVDYTRGSQKTALFEAVELKHYRAVELLIEHGANPLLEKGGWHCPFIQSLRQSVEDFDVVWNALQKRSGNDSEERPDRAENVDTTIADRFLSAQWDRHTSRMSDDPQALSLLQLLNGEGLYGQAQRIQNLGPSSLVDGMYVQVGQGTATPKCSYPNCQEAVSLRPCRACSRSYCPNHVAQHNCPEVRELAPPARPLPFTSVPPPAHSPPVAHPVSVAPVHTDLRLPPSAHAPIEECCEPGCVSMEGLERCDKCGKVFCADHMGDHPCPE